MTDSDTEILLAIEAEMLQRAGGRDAFCLEVPKLLRRSIDEVIDAPRTARLTFNQLEKTEKTYIGTKIEILLRNFLDIPKGILDLEVNGVDVDIKNTTTGNWMIPREAFDKACILISSNELTALCSIGLIVCRMEYLTSGQNRDQKKSISAEGRKHIRWIMKDQPYPKNFWEQVSLDEIKAIMAGKSGNERLVILFRQMTGLPISRQVVEGIARQKDYMKRLRKNGGARDQLAKEGIALLSGHYDRVLIKNLGLPECGKDEFISFKGLNAEQQKLLSDSGHL